MSRLEAAARLQRNEEILALLEERPYTASQLAGLLGVSSGMTQFLGGLARSGAVAKLADGRWVRKGEEPTVGTVAPEPRRFIDREAVELQLRDGPVPLKLMAERLGVNPSSVIRRLDVMAAAGLVKRIGAGHATRWALATWMPLPPPPPKPPERGRQAHERPPAQTVKKDIPPSWWVTAPANGFTELANSQLDRMQESKFSRVARPHVPDLL